MPMPPSGLPLDTSLDAYRIHIASLRQMGPSQRLQQMLELSDFVRATVESGIRHRHPEYTPEQVRLATHQHLLGPHLFGVAYPGAEWLKP